MPTNGMTINGLNPLSALTADDKIPVWDTGASGEPTKEITAQNMANSVKSLASLPNTTEMNDAIAQSTAKLTWKLIGETKTASSTPITLPSDWKELLVQFDNNGYYITSYFLRNMFVDSKTVSGGNYGTSWILLDISPTSAKINRVNWDGQDVNSGTAWWYYR